VIDQMTIQNEDKVIGMIGETDLTILLRSMTPELHAGTFVFCTFSESLPDGLSPIMTFHEAEGITAIVKKQQADQLGVDYTFPSAWITLTVHSSLTAVGLTVAVARALSDQAISCNVVAAYYHDHLFVPVENGERALEILKALAKG
jgi:uncharacterized protein